MSFKNTLVRKVVSVSLCAVIGFTGFTLGYAPKASAATSKADKIITLGKKYLGVKYRFGAPSGSTSAFDCSSFTQYIYGKYGVKLPRVSSTQATKGVKVAKGSLKKGDLVFFKVKRTGSKIGHVGVYVGNNKMLHTYGSPGVTYSTISSGYWKSHYVTARRVL
ncbi:C40 family peptidase [Cohnella silvisoli]|uniref:C40 family peptidase n=1 Tax=Cohnella silvisoli TaxID=2873699 RepID=A0ABV1KNP5_9BACL|nr:C40 family peptidase [Cohnella silvisoli]MCD9020986.1 C40 family peptidase [Cohnella silvisoli]